MSGWIKIERSLLSDLRFRKVVRKIAGTVGNADKSLPPVTVTLVLGALTQLWLHADEHIGEDDVLRGSIDDINELVGIDNFCQNLPADWLKVVDPDHVQLTDFVSHNGTSARERKLNAIRQARFKAKRRTADGNAGLMNGNAGNAARPIQSRPDHTKPLKSEDRLETVSERQKSKKITELLPGASGLVARMKTP